MRAKRQLEQEEQEKLKAFREAQEEMTEAIDADTARRRKYLNGIRKIS
jgi:hypothetical protein